MSDLSELLRRHGSPAPNAMAMPGETRSDDGLFFEIVNHPSSQTFPNSTLAEWSCTLNWSQVETLQAFLKTPFETTGKMPEELIDEAMKQLGIGNFLGTFLAKHAGGSEVRVLLNYTPGPGQTIETIYAKWATFLANPPAALAPAAAAMTQLRKYWLAGAERLQAGLMLLAGVDLQARLADPTKFPFAAIDRTA
jgi:hypothetical protein